MAPIDYSKWVNIDTDSDEELPPPPISVPKANPAPPSATPQLDASIQAVIVRCKAEKSKFVPWSTKMILADDPIFSQPRASDSQEQKGFRPGKAGVNDPDDWRLAKSPHEM